MPNETTIQNIKKVGKKEHSTWKGPRFMTHPGYQGITPLIAILLSVLMMGVMVIYAIQKIGKRLWYQPDPSIAWQSSQGGLISLSKTSTMS